MVLPNIPSKPNILTKNLDEASEGNWVDFDGTAFSYSNWYPDQPNNNNGNEHWVHFGTSGIWNDVPEDRERTHIVCVKGKTLVVTFGLLNYLSDTHVETEEIGMLQAAKIIQATTKAMTTKATTTKATTQPTATTSTMATSATTTVPTIVLTIVPTIAPTTESTTQNTTSESTTKKLETGQCGLELSDAQLQYFYRKTNNSGGT